MRRHFIFTGQVRDLSNFCEELEKAEVLLRERLIEGITWATWSEEAEDMTPQLRDQASRCGLQVIKVKKPEGQEGDPSSLYQSTQVLAALRSLPGDDYVLKSRPDVKLPLNRARRFLECCPTGQTGSFVKAHWGLSNKILVSWFDPSQFFTMCDLCYAGRVSDLEAAFASGEAAPFRELNHNAGRHFGNLAFPMKSESSGPWYQWLSAYYPGSAARQMAGEASLPMRSLYRRLQSLSFQWPDLFWRVAWQDEKELRGVLLGWQIYLRFVAEGCQFPMPCTEERARLAGRSYWADSWPEVGILAMDGKARPAQGVAGDVFCKGGSKYGSSTTSEFFSAADKEWLTHALAGLSARLASRQLVLLVETALGLARVRAGRLRRTICQSLKADRV